MKCIITFDKDFGDSHREEIEDYLESAKKTAQEVFGGEYVQARGVAGEISMVNFTPHLPHFHEILEDRLKELLEEEGVVAEINSDFTGNSTWVKPHGETPWHSLEDRSKGRISAAGGWTTRPRVAPSLPALAECPFPLRLPDGSDDSCGFCGQGL